MKKKKLPSKSQVKAIKTLLGLFLTFIISFYFWIADTFGTVEIPSSNEPFKLYSTELRDDLTLAFAQAIQDAKKSVTFSIYSLKDPRIISALKAKGEEGCQVKVICDAKTSVNVEKNLGPNVKVLKRFTSGLMHQKILVIDGHTTWIGSANMTRESLRHYGNLVTAINNKALATLALSKANSFTEDDRLMLLPHHTFTVANQKLELSFLPDDTLAVDRLKTLMQSATKSMRIAMFTFTHFGLAQEVIKAHKKGIKVEVVIDNSSAIGASAKVVDLLEKSGVMIKRSSGTALLHHKFMYIDEKTLVHGSANWTLAAFNKNDDCFVIIHSLDETQKKFMNRLWKTISNNSN